jgi:hypothetical protein
MSNRLIDPGEEEAELARQIIAAAPGVAADAEAALYRRLAPRVRRYGRRHSRDEQAGADLTQQVMLMTVRAHGLDGVKASIGFHPSNQGRMLTQPSRWRLMMCSTPAFTKTTSGAMSSCVSLLRAIEFSQA